MKREIINYIIVGIIVVLVTIAGYFIYNKITPKELPSNLIAGTGRIDGDLIFLNTKYTARMHEISVYDGDLVRKGDVIARLASKEIEAKLEAVSEGINATRKEQEAFNASIEVSEMELLLLSRKLPKLVEKKKQKSLELEASLNGIESQITQIKLQLKQDSKDLNRNMPLLRDKSISDHDFELVQLKKQSTEQKLLTTTYKRSEIKEKLNSAKTDVEIATADLEQIDIKKQSIKSQRIRMDAVGARIKQLQAQKKEIIAMMNELEIRSPIDGLVVDRVAQPGMVVGGGGAIALLIDPSELYLKIFVDTLENGKISIGDSAVIFLDALPEYPIEAKVVRVEQRAEFTPKEVQIRSDRIQLMFAVHIKPVKMHSYLKLGLPAIGVISTDGKGLPEDVEMLGGL